MRLRVYEAATLPEALETMRRELGPDAVLVGSRRVGGRVRVTAALAREEPDLAPLFAGAGGGGGSWGGVLASVWARHDVGRDLALRLEGALCGAAGDVEAALAGALGRVFAGLGAADLPAGAHVVLGPPGAGRTASLVKLAVRLRLAGRAVAVAAVGEGKVGERARLRGLLAPLGLEPGALPAAPSGWWLVDAAGFDPLDGRALAAAAELLAGRRLEGLAVLPATLHPAEAGEIAANLAALGVRRLVVTKLDLTRRMGALLAMLEAGLEPLGVGIGPDIASGLPPLTPAALARLLLRRGGG